MKIPKRLINILLIFAVFTTACQKSKLQDEIPVDSAEVRHDTIPQYVQTANVYVGGSTYDSITHVEQAAYWKNEVAVILTHGTKDAGVSGIAVEGDDVYAAGYTTDDNGAYIATYWKNGVQVNLTSNITNASSGSIVVKGNDVYIAGFIDNYAVYWKNERRVFLPLLPGMSIGSSAGIAIQGSDVYVSGYQVGNKAASVYWKNNTATRLPNDSISYAGKNIVFHDGNMYMPATYPFPYSGKEVVNYWKNGAPVSLADGVVGINAIEIAVNGNDVYLACNTTKGAGYFKNDKLTLLPDEFSEMTGIAVLDNDVYTSTQSTYQKKSVAAFWKNDIPVYLSSPIGRGGFASSIVVKPLK